MFCPNHTSNTTPLIVKMYPDISIIETYNNRIPTSYIVLPIVDLYSFIANILKNIMYRIYLENKLQLTND